MRQLGIDLLEHEHVVLRLFREVIAEPPLRLPADHDLGGLPQVIHDLIEVSLLQPRSLAAHQEKIADAVRHGEWRRTHGSPERIIFEEFAALREALRRYLATCDSPRWVKREAIMRLDMAISVAELGSIRGYHRAAFEQAGLWESLVVNLAQQSPLLSLPEPEQRQLS